MIYNEMFRHMLATLSYRTTQAVSNAPENFPELQIGNDVRTPRVIIRHMSRVLTYAHSQFEPDDYANGYEFPSGPWEWEVERFYGVVEKLDTLFSTSKTGNLTWQQLLQGPLADVLTHVGQLTLLRRMADSPVQYENFIEVDIRSGELRR